MTPRYASPEQRNGGVITTGSDVYSLGLVLYELLTGVLPDTEPGEDPPRPSVVAEIPRTARRLRGDLDRILLRALRPDPRDRYPSVDALAEDLERYLDGRPVRARGNAFTYRLSRFVLRHRRTLVPAFLAGVALLWLGGQLILQDLRLAKQAEVLAEQRDQARLEKGRAEEVTRLVVELFQTADPASGFDDGTTAAQILGRGVQFARGFSEGEPLARAQMLHILGEAYVGLGKLKTARELVEEAHAIRREVWGDGDPRLLDGLESLVHLLVAAGADNEALTLASEAGGLSETLDVEDPLYAKASFIEGVAHRLGGEAAQAEECQRRALRILDLAAPPGDPPLRARVLLELERIERPEGAARSAISEQGHG
jgi:serine/threonine-protein kinase